MQTLCSEIPHTVFDTTDNAEKDAKSRKERENAIIVESEGGENQRKPLHTGGGIEKKEKDCLKGINSA